MIADSSKNGPTQADDPDNKNALISPEFTSHTISDEEYAFDGKRKPAPSTFAKSLISRLEDDGLYLFINDTFQSKGGEIRFINTENICYTLVPAVYNFASPTDHCSLSYGKFKGKKLKVRIMGKKTSNPSDPCLHNHCFLPLARLTLRKFENQTRVRLHYYSVI